MSSYQPKDGSGALFKNDKGDNPARPDYRGDLMVGGVVYEVSGWIKPLPKDAAQKFMSLAAKLYTPHQRYLMLEALVAHVRTVQDKLKEAA